MTEPLYVSKPFTPAHSFTDGIESPACDKKGMLYVVNFARQGTIGRVTPAGECSLYIQLPAGSIPNAVRFRRDGTMLIADYTGHNIYQVDPKTHKASVFAHDATMTQPNDLAVTTSGLIFASNPKWADDTGSVWRADLNGKLTCAAPDMGTTNGIEVSPDDKTLYVNESIQRRIWAFDIAPNGDLTNKRLLIEFSDFGLDGMRVDVDGNLYVTRFRKGVIAKVSPTGEVLLEIKLNGERPSGLCFGGPDGCIIYVAEVEHGRIEAFRVEQPGREWRLWQSV